MSSRSRPSPEPPASFHVESLGCAKNQVDSELMIAALERAGWARAADADDATVVVVNTCGFISSAKKESIETGLALRARYPGKKIYMVGCLPQRYAEELRGSMPEIDGFLGNADPPGVAEGIVGLVGRPPGRRAGTGPGSTAGSRPGSTPGSTAAAKRRPRAWERTHLLSFPGSAYVKVAEGCSNRCTYCAIPLIRGDLKSRPRSEVLDEIRGLASRGIREVILIAQDLGSWGRDAGPGRQARAGSGLVDLLEGISGIRGDFRVRMLYIHPDRFPRELPAAVKADRRFLPYFDVPFQHASPRILSAMGRLPDPRRNLDLVRAVRAALPGAVVRSTFLVGFPGETEEDFELLRAFQQDAALDWLGVFTYSREEDTPAWSMGGRVPKAAASRRKTLVEQAQVPITERALDRRVGERLEVLIEEPFQDGEFSLGRSYLQAPEVDGLVVVRGSFPAGSLVRARVTRRNGFDLEAEAEHPRG
jgi:ribosomal protein S12 methylthiotransferase